MNDESEWEEKGQTNGEYEFYKAYNICSSNSFLSNMIGNVNPRSFAGLDGHYAKQDTLDKQVAFIETLLARLTSQTLFEVEGWKRILGVTKMFEAFNLNQEDFNLIARKTSHPTSIGIRSFQEKILEQKERGEVFTNLKTPWFKDEPTNFVVS